MDHQPAQRTAKRKQNNNTHFEEIEDFPNYFNQFENTAKKSDYANELTISS